MKNVLDENNIIDNVKLGQIKESTIHGHGLFAISNIKKGTVLGFLDGQLFKKSDYYSLMDLVKEDIYDVKNYLFMEWNAITEKILLVRAFRTKYSFINHSRTPNIKIYHNPIRLVAICDIDSGDELFLDYREEPLGKEYLEGHGKTYL